MRSQFVGNCDADENGPLAPGPEGEEDFRSLLLAMAGTLWPEDGEGSWLASFGESGPDADDSGRSIFTVEPSVREDEGIPLVSLALAVGFALSVAGAMDLSQVKVETEISEENLSWIRWSWAKNLARHTDSWQSGAYCIVESESEMSSKQSILFVEALANALYYSGRSYSVTAVDGHAGVFRVHALRWGFLHAGLLLDAACCSLARAGHRGPVQIRVQSHFP